MLCAHADTHESVKPKDTSQLWVLPFSHISDLVIYSNKDVYLLDLCGTWQI